jgi:hypothetical protein
MMLRIYTTWLGAILDELVRQNNQEPNNFFNCDKMLDRFTISRRHAGQMGLQGD